MIRTLALALAASALVASPAAAWQDQQPAEEPPARNILNRILDRVLGPEEQAEQADQVEETVTEQNTIPLETILAADFRADDRARDQYRHPTETLDFFRVQPGMTVAEYAPGGGWYSRIIAPYVAQQGRYLAVNLDADARDLNDEQRSQAASWPVRFVTSVQQQTGVPATAVTAFESDEIPAGLEGSADRILIFRNMHSLLNYGVVQNEMANLRRLLADDGLVGVVQHRAPETASWEDANGSRGYVKQSDIVALFDVYGFELVQSSEINANRNDRADYERGVWTLPPTYALGDADRDRYTAIGESDRMTLLFRKAD